MRKHEESNHKNQAKENPFKQQKLSGRAKFLTETSLPYQNLSVFEQKMQMIFRQFKVDSFTFHLFIINCFMWLAQNLYYYFIVHDWECVQYMFFAKHQPTISYSFELWRIFFATFIFRGWLMFFFNNFALNMLGYCIQKQSQFKMIFTFYMGVMGGHLLSCCFMDAQSLSTGTSCGTIALLPLEICRFIKLKKQNPLQALKRRRFILINITSNFILNVLAIFGLDPVDWISHIGCIVSGILCMFIFEDMKGLIYSSQIGNNGMKKRKFIRIVALIALFIYLLIMWIVVIWRLPSTSHGQNQLRWIQNRCDRYIQ